MSSTPRSSPEVVVITGASAGVGRATAREFARRGARLGLVARGRERLEATQREVERLGGRAIILAADVADPNTAERITSLVEAEFGAIDICSTTASRIRQNPELFAQLAPQEQEMIRRGEGAVGFTAEMVRLALGEPDRYGTRTDADGTSETWSYVTYDGPTGVPLYRGWYHRYYMWGDPLYPYYLSVDDRRVRDRFSVIFRNGRVTALERETTR